MHRPEKGMMRKYQMDCQQCLIIFKENKKDLKQKRCIRKEKTNNYCEKHKRDDKLAS